jgi:hypothetical protein
MKEQIQKWMKEPMILVPVLVVTFVILLGLMTFVFQSREVRGYFVKWERGYYYVTADVKGGFNFVSYVSLDGNEAIDVMNRLNGDLMKEQGRAIRNATYIR